MLFRSAYLNIIVLKTDEPLFHVNTHTFDFHFQSTPQEIQVIRAVTYEPQLLAVIRVLTSMGANSDATLCVSA